MCCCILKLLLHVYISNCFWWRYICNFHTYVDDAIFGFLVQYTKKRKKKIWTWKSFKKLGSQSFNQSITVYLQSALFPPYCAWAIQLTLQKEGEKVNTPRHLLLSSKPKNYTLQILHSYSIISFHKSAYFVKNSTNFPNHDTSVVNGFLIA